jgi:hypothetical protein
VRSVADYTDRTYALFYEATDLAAVLDPLASVDVQPMLALQGPIGGPARTVTAVVEHGTVIEFWDFSLLMKPGAPLDHVWELDGLFEWIYMVDLGGFDQPLGTGGAGVNMSKLDGALAELDGFLCVNDWRGNLMVHFTKVDLVHAKLLHGSVLRLHDHPPGLPGGSVIREIGPRESFLDAILLVI